MPRLLSFRETRRFDIYDSIGFSTQTSLATVMFGYPNIGTIYRCNTQVPGQIASDQTAYIQNIYARTNIPHDLAAFVEWSHAATATLCVGDRPVLQRPVAELLRIGPGEVIDSGFADPVAMARIQNRALAEELYAANYQHAPAGCLPFHMLAESERDRWMELAGTARRATTAPDVVLVPLRQNMSVVLGVEIHTMAKLRESMPAGISPEPLVWVHLEGYSRRDVA